MASSTIEIRTITKHYPGVKALDGVSLQVGRGEVLAIVGENGAGKSTLMKILGGVIAPDSGEILVDGKSLRALSVKSSMAAGIAFVHQELNLFDNLSVAANIFIGREPRQPLCRFLVAEHRMADLARPLLRQLGADFDVATLVGALSLAEKQLVEIAKALSLNARLIIMDEPTSSLTAGETERLLQTIARLRADGVSIIFISHRLGEVQAVADRVQVLRDGRTVAELTGAEIRPETMIRHMIGRDLTSIYRPPAAPPGEIILQLSDLKTQYWPGESVNLAIRRGEILGLAGLVGAGRTELARALFGLDKPLAGQISMDGAAIDIPSPRAAIARGLYLIPEDRKRNGLVLDFPIQDNITLASLQDYSRFGLADRNQESLAALRQKQALDIRAPGTMVKAQSLSGGNQQKVVLGKWLSMAPRVLIFDEPTRGIDVGAKQEIYQLMRKLADDGVAILMISSDMEEIIGVSDRVAVMHEGRIAGELARAEVSEAAILSLAVGRNRAETAPNAIHERQVTA